MVVNNDMIGPNDWKTTEVNSFLPLQCRPLVQWPGTTAEEWNIVIPGHQTFYIVFISLMKKDN